MELTSLSFIAGRFQRSADKWLSKIPKKIQTAKNPLLRLSEWAFFNSTPYPIQSFSLSYCGVQKKLYICVRGF